jgi:hypothetical protein
MEHKFRDILEHDMDMLFLEEFACSKHFCKIFLDKINVDDAQLLLTWQSKTDDILGESDMTVIFDCHGKKLALLIEDKIDAIAMPEQPSRYILRGNKGIQDGEYDSYHVFIVAPREYLNKNEKAKEYPNSVSYEEIKVYFERLNDSRSGFKLTQINLAIEKQKNGYQIVKNASVTDFWNKYVDYKNTYFPNLKLVNNSDIKPTNGVWVHFRINDGKSCIYYKSNKGYVDLTFNGQANNIEILKSFVLRVIGDYYDKGISIVKTGKSCAIRKIVPIVDFSNPFNEQLPNIKQSFETVEELTKIANKLDVARIYTALSI